MKEKRKIIGYVIGDMAKIFYSKEEIDDNTKPEDKQYFARAVNPLYTINDTHKKLLLHNQASINKKELTLLKSGRNIDCPLYWICFHFISVLYNWSEFSCEFCSTNNGVTKIELVNFLEDLCLEREKGIVLKHCRAELNSWKMPIFLNKNTNNGNENQAKEAENEIPLTIPFIFRIISGKTEITTPEIVLRKAVKKAGDLSLKQSRDVRLYKVEDDNSLTEVHYKQIYYRRLEKENKKKEKSGKLNSSSYYELIIGKSLEYLRKIKLEQARKKARKANRDNPETVTLYRITIKGRYKEDY